MRAVQAHGAAGDDPETLIENGRLLPQPVPPLPGWLFSQTATLAEQRRLLSDWLAGRRPNGLTEALLAPVDYYHVIAGKVAGADALMSRTGYTGEDGFEIILPAEQAEPLWRSLSGAGVVPSPRMPVVTPCMSLPICRPSPLRSWPPDWSWMSMKPGAMKPPGMSMCCVCSPRSAMIVARSPTARMRSPRMRTAYAAPR